MRKALVLIMALIVMLPLSACGSAEKEKQDIFTLVENNYDAIVQACKSKDADALLAIEGIKDVDFADDYVFVYCEGYGIAPSSQYYGFYYSAENLPVAVFDGQIIADTDELTEEGSGYKYLDAGYNSFYTEHIKGSIYFYSASF